MDWLKCHKDGKGTVIRKPCQVVDRRVVCCVGQCGTSRTIIFDFLMCVFYPSVKGGGLLKSWKISLCTFSLVGCLIKRVTHILWSEENQLQNTEDP